MAQQQQNTEMWSKAHEFVLPLAILGCLLVFLVPLPGAVMDCLLVANIAIALLVLLTTLFVRCPLEFGVFPTVLLATTLARLVLNVATTRLILTRADSVGMRAAGDVVKQFGQYVSGDRLLVGLIIFAIIFIIQMLVITKGATRISEVAARFALDGVAGRQLAIDADLSSGAIDQSEARHRREQVNRQADFFGAMDGASKFIRGDAVAGLAITAINIVGGLFIGVVQGSMGLGEATELYTKLTIGDGLVSQIPALLISLAAGLLVTRGSESTNLPTEFIRQLFAKPEVLAVSGCFLGLLVFTKLPSIPLLIVAIGFVGAAYFHDAWVPRLASSPASMASAAPKQPAGKKKHSPAASARRVEDFLQVDPVELQLGRRLVRLANSARGGDLLGRITRLREFVASDLGIVLPSVRVRDNLSLDDHQYRIRFLGNLVDEGETPKQGAIILPPRGLKSRQLPFAQNYTHPALEDSAKLIPVEHLEAAIAMGCGTVSESQLIARHLHRTVSTMCHELLTRDATQKLLDEVAKTAPAVVDELIPHVMKLGQVQQVLQGLLCEGVPIRQLATILEALCDFRSQADNLAELTELVRIRLGRTISDRYVDDDGQIHVVTLAPQLEKQLAVMGEADALGLHPKQRLGLQSMLKSAIERLTRENRTPIILTRSEIRVLVRNLAMNVVPGVVVLGKKELASYAQVCSVGIVEFMME